MPWNPRLPVYFKEIFRGGAASKVESRGRIKSVTQKSLLLLPFSSLFFCSSSFLPPPRRNVSRYGEMPLCPDFRAVMGFVPLFRRLKEILKYEQRCARVSLKSARGWRNKSRRRDNVLRVLFIWDLRVSRKSRVWRFVSLYLKLVDFELDVR